MLILKKIVLWLVYSFLFYLFASFVLGFISWFVGEITWSGAFEIPQEIFLPMFWIISLASAYPVFKWLLPGTKPNSYCPYCKERVKNWAVKCPHCREDIRTESTLT